MITNMTKPFMKKELSEKVVLYIFKSNLIPIYIYNSKYTLNYVVFQLFYHSVNSETIFEHVPKEIMPIEFGGSGKSIKDINGG